MNTHTHTSKQASKQRNKQTNIRLPACAFVCVCQRMLSKDAKSCKIRSKHANIISFHIISIHYIVRAYVFSSCPLKSGEQTACRHVEVAVAVVVSCGPHKWIRRIEIRCFNCSWIQPPWCRQTWRSEHEQRSHFEKRTPKAYMYSITDWNII